MSITTIVTELLDELERPDLQKKCQTFVPQAIRFAHSARLFSKDLTTTVVADPVVTDSNRVSLSLIDDLPRLRKVFQLNFYAGYSEPLPGDYSPFNEILVDQPYRNRAEMNDVKDYYGFQYKNVYAMAGDQLVIDGADKQTKALAIRYFAWPEISINEVTREYQTDSWIVREWPELVKAYLRRKLASVIDKRELRNDALEDFRLTYESFLNENSEEFY